MVLGERAAPGVAGDHAPARPDEWPLRASHDLGGTRDLVARRLKPRESLEDRHVGLVFGVLQVNGQLDRHRPPPARDSLADRLAEHNGYLASTVWPPCPLGAGREHRELVSGLV